MYIVDLAARSTSRFMLKRKKATVCLPKDTYKNKECCNEYDSQKLKTIQMPPTNFRHDPLFSIKGL